MKWSDLLLPSPKYATHNLYKKWEGTMSPGILYPVWHKLMLPGDKFKINLRHLFRSNPTKAPLFSSFKVRFVTVVANLKNYAIALEGYRRNFDWRTTTLPHFSWSFAQFETGRPTTDIYPSSILPRMGVRETSLFDYLGYPRGWIPTSQQYKTNVTSSGANFVKKAAIPFLVYYDFFRNYMVNPQAEYFPQFRPAVSTDPSLNGKSYLTPVRLSSLDEFFEHVHTYYDGSNSGSLYSAYPDFDSLFGFTHYDPWFYREGSPDARNVMSSFHGGLVPTLYDPDMNTQWMSSTNFAKMNEVRINTQSTTGVDPQQFTSFSDIVKASSLWQFMMGEVYGDGTYANHVYSQYGVSVKADMNIPQIVHVTDSVLSFEDITSQSDTQQNAGSEDESGSPVGQQYGVGRSAGATPSFTIHNSDKNLAMAMTFCWITPNVRYADGLHPDTNIIQLSDIYVPAFDNYSLQPLLQEQLLSSPSADGDYMNGSNSDGFVLNSFGPLSNAVIGYQPAFTEYKTDVSTVHGLLKSSLSYWTIVRNFPQSIGATGSGWINAGYVYDASHGNYVPEEDAVTYNMPFSVENEDNFQCQIVFDVTAIRPISKSVLPNVR